MAAVRWRSPIFSIGPNGCGATSGGALPIIEGGASRWGPGSGGLRMPYFQNPLTLEQQELIYDWIQQGAKGEPEDEAPIAREGIFRDSLESLRF